MKLSPRLSLILAAACGASLLATAAQAFTIENYGGSNGGSAARLNDQTPQRPEYGTIGPSNGPKIQQGNTTLQFGGSAYQGGSFNQRYDSSRLFDPIARDR